MSGFRDTLGPKSHMKVAVYKNPENPSRILTNYPHDFQVLFVMETGLLDFYRTVVTV